MAVLADKKAGPHSSAGGGGGWGADTSYLNPLYLIGY